MTALPHPLVRVERVEVAGTNAWVVGDDDECLVIDAPPGAATAIAAVVGGRRVHGILCTHGHVAHIASALTLSDISAADVFLHPGDYGSWREVFPTRWPEVLMDGITFDVGTARLVGIHVPGHTDGGMCWYAETLGSVFTGDSLAADGAGRGLQPAQRTRLVSAVRARLFTLPPLTVIRPGHGPDGRIGTVRWARDSWT
jgi:glyoxylase-like metal-dependent hydrolase (beta-lactamase superfamily II)